MFDFSDKRVLIAGGSSGIGLATAQLAARTGAEVTIASRSAVRLEKAAALIGPGTKCAVLDLTHADDVQRFSRLLACGITS